MGLLKGFTDKISTMRQQAKDKKDFFNNLLVAAEDGRFTEEEIKQLQAQSNELGLKPAEMKQIRVSTYITAFQAAKCDGVVTTEEEAELAKIQEFLEIPDCEISKSKQELAKLRVLAEIQNGNLPTIVVRNVILQKTEVAYWAEPGDLIEEKVVRRRYEGGSRGMSFRIAKGVSYRVGGHKGQVVSDVEDVPVSSGDLIVTNKRVIFRGDAKSFNFRLDKLLEIGLFGNGIRITGDKGKPRMVQFNNGDNADVVGATLSYAINNFEG